MVQIMQQSRLNFVHRGFPYDVDLDLQYRQSSWKSAGDNVAGIERLRKAVIRNVISAKERKDG